MAASCWRAFDEINFFSCFTMLFLFVFGIITCVFILKQLFTLCMIICFSASFSHQRSTKFLLKLNHLCCYFDLRDERIKSVAPITTALFKVLDVIL